MSVQSLTNLAVVTIAPVGADSGLPAECRRLREAQRISRVGSWHYDLVSCVFHVSDTLLELHGLQRGALLGAYETLEVRVHPEDREELLTAINGLATGQTDMATRYRVLRDGDGTQRWLEARGTSERDRDGNIIEFAGTVADISELVQAEAKVRHAHAELSDAHHGLQEVIAHQQAVISATPDAIHVYDVASGSLSRANRNPGPLIGFTPEVIDVMGGGSIETLIPEKHRRRLEETYTAAAALADGEVVQLRHQVLHDGGDVRWLSRRMTPFARTKNGSVSSILVISRDVSDVVEVEERLKHSALHDELTGLPNRRLVHDRLEHAIRRAARGGHTAVLICDLDGFKGINDSRGHSAGDEVLREVAQRLLAATRPGDTVARMGGDEFAFVLDVPQHENPDVVARGVAERIVTAIAEPIQAGDLKHALSISIGIRIADGDCTAETLLQDADAAMYHVKSHGGNGHAFFEIAHRPDNLPRAYVEGRIRHALAADLIEVHYQPIVNPVTNALHGVEALLRLRDEFGTYLDTEQVINVAEQTGLITALDEHVLHIACAQAAAWREGPDLNELTLKINCSVTDITRSGFHDRIWEAVTRSGLPPHALTLEITETVLLDATDNDLADLRALHARGIGLALDDFGTGYASLRYLAELPITCIKIDRSFTNRLPSDATSMTLVRATIGLAEQLKMDCVVEGVETLEQLRALPPYGRLLIQGYLYAKPQNATTPLRANFSPGIPDQHLTSSVTQDCRGNAQVA